jgi:hypothetical protein
VLKFQWNALRRGHRVTLHDPASVDMALIPGTVVLIEAHRGRGGVNGVGIRVEDDNGAGRVVRPSYLAVHLEPDDSTEPCWRCDELAATLPPARQCGRCRGTFPGDPTLPRGVELGWWACPPCHALLLGPGAMAKPTWAAKVPSGAR